MKWQNTGWTHVQMPPAQCFPAKLQWSFGIYDKATHVRKALLSSEGVEKFRSKGNQKYVGFLNLMNYHMNQFGVKCDTMLFSKLTLFYCLGHDNDMPMAPVTHLPGPSPICLQGTQHHTRRQDLTNDDTDFCSFKWITTRIMQWSDSFSWSVSPAKCHRSMHFTLWKMSLPISTFLSLHRSWRCPLKSSRM